MGIKVVRIKGLKLPSQVVYFESCFLSYHASYVMKSVGEWIERLDKTWKER